MSEQRKNDSRQEDTPNLDGPQQESPIVAQTQAALKIVMEGVKTSNALPSGQRRDLYDTYSSFRQLMGNEGKRVLQLIHMVLQHQNIRGNIIRRDVEEKFDLLVEANDTILEKVGTALDELAGIRKNSEPAVLVNVSSSTRAVSGSWNKNTNSSAQIVADQESSSRLLTAKNIERPQSKFKDKVDNSNTPWIPGIKDKPNSLKPLSITLEVYDDGEGFSHPYQFELERFSPPQHQLVRADPIPPRDVKETPLIIVDRREQINAMVEDLRAQTIIGVDLEHHSYRSFQGFTCLLQISTREKDYIVDTLSLRSDLHVLNEVFTSTKIIKVFHGARCDIEWLQHDLNVYVVNMFDTHEASKSLNFPRTSLACLLKHYCDFDANKQFQFADWRIRPLPQELLDYARSDTHYILYIHDMMRNALLNERNGLNLLKAVYQRSTEVCLRRYFKNIFTEDSHMDLYRRSRKNFDNRQMYAYKHMFEWRDRVARLEDDSTGFVLPNHMLLKVAESLPREAQGILACCNPIPPLVRQYLMELHQIILKAREQPLVKPMIEEELRKRPVQTWSKLNMDDPLYCPHDLSQHGNEVRDDLPTLLEIDEQSDDLVVTTKKNDSDSTKTTFDRVKTVGSMLDIGSENDLEFHTSCIGLFNSGVKDGDTSVVSATSKVQQVTFLSPFERYKRARAFMDTIAHREDKVVNGDAANHVQNQVNLDGKDSEDGPSTSSEANSKVREKPKDTTPAASLAEDIVPLRALAKGVKRKAQSLKGGFQVEGPKAKAMKFDDDPHFRQQKKKKNNKKKLKQGAETSKPLQEDQSKKNSGEQKSANVKSEPSSADYDESKTVDIKKVDFGRFRGGSLPEKRHKEVEARFKGKRRNKGGSFKGSKGNKRGKHQ